LGEELNGKDLTRKHENTKKDKAFKKKFNDIGVYQTSFHGQFLPPGPFSFPLLWGTVFSDYILKGTLPVSLISFHPSFSIL